MVKLIGIQGPEKGKIFQLGQKAILGREQGNEILINNTKTSRKHAIIMKYGQGYHIIDLNSRNGTLVNSIAVHDKALTNNDYIQIGSSVLQFVVGETRINQKNTVQIVKDEIAPSTILGTLTSDQMGTTLFGQKDEKSNEDAEAHSPTQKFYSEKRLTKILEMANQRLQVLYRVTEKIGHNLDLESCLSDIMESLFQLFPQADRGVILLYTDKGELSPALVSTQDGKQSGPIQVSQTILQQAVKNKESLLSANAMQDDRFKMGASVALNQIRSVMCVPLIYRENDVLGVLQLDSRITVKEFDKEDLDLITSVGSLIAVSIKAAHTHKDLLEKERLERDLSLATTIQQSFLPQEFPRLAGVFFDAINIPARAVGGDLYDIFEHPKGGVGIMIGDVSGKGIAASLYMARISSEFRIHSRTEEHPEQVFEKINNNLFQRSTLGMFVTLQYIYIAPNGKEAFIINGGHPLPLLYSTKTKKAKSLEAVSAPPIGILPNRTYVSTRFPLSSGDTLILYTDGVVEAKNPEGSPFNTPILIQAVEKFFATHTPSSTFIPHLVEEVHRWTERDDHFDDLTLVLIHIT
jgi:sigma-B regulation protein RsbU (phosphoserine phosphatase)